METRRCKCFLGGNILLLFENKRSIIFKAFVLLFNCLESLNMQTFTYLVAFSFIAPVSLNESFRMISRKMLLINWLILIDSGTAPGQAETFDYSSKMAASKEAAAAAAAKVPAPPDPYFVLIWLSWIWIRIGKADLDPGAWRLTKINKQTWFDLFPVLWTQIRISKDPHESVLIWLSWIRIRIGNADPDPGAWILTKINKQT